MAYHSLFSVTIPWVTKSNQSAIDCLKELNELHADLKFNIQMAVEWQGNGTTKLEIRSGSAQRISTQLNLPRSLTTGS